MADQKRRTRRYAPALYAKLKDWHESGRVTIWTIGPHRRDRSSPCIDMGEALIPLHAAWLPPIGARRQVKIFATKRGTYYAVPAGERQEDGTLKFHDNLLDGEFDKSRQGDFRVVLQANRDGRLAMSLPSGQKLIPLDQDQWYASGAKDLVGRTIEVTGLTATTCWLVLPKHGYENLGMTEELSDKTRDKVAIASMRARERAMGFVRIDLEGGEDLPISAFSLLRLSPEDKLSIDLLKQAARKRHAEIQNGPEFREEPAVGLVSKGALMAAVTEARKCLAALIKTGATSFLNHIGGEGEVAEEESDKDTEPAPTVAEVSSDIVICPGCGQKNRLPAGTTADQLRCGRCKTDLVPPVAPVDAPEVIEAVPAAADDREWAEDLALNAIAAGYRDRGSREAPDPVEFAERLAKHFELAELGRPNGRDLKDRQRGVKSTLGCSLEKALILLTEAEKLCPVGKTTAKKSK